MSVCLAASSDAYLSFGVLILMTFIFISTILQHFLQQCPAVHSFFTLYFLLSSFVAIAFAVVCGNFGALLQVRTINVYSYRRNIAFSCRLPKYYLLLAHAYIQTIRYKRSKHININKYKYVCPCAKKQNVYLI